MQDMKAMSQGKKTSCRAAEVNTIRGGNVGASELERDFDRVWDSESMFCRSGNARYFSICERQRHRTFRSSRRCIFRLSSRTSEISVLPVRLLEIEIPISHCFNAAP